MVRNRLILACDEYTSVALCLFACLGFILVPRLFPFLLVLPEELLALAPIQYMRRRILVLHPELVSTLRRLVRPAQKGKRRIHRLVP